jgi:hypothetical protein
MKAKAKAKPLGKKAMKKTKGGVSLGVASVAGAQVTDKHKDWIELDARGIVIK